MIEHQRFKPNDRVAYEVYPLCKGTVVARDEGFSCPMYIVRLDHGCNITIFEACLVKIDDN